VALPLLDGGGSTITLNLVNGEFLRPPCRLLRCFKLVEDMGVVIISCCI
jgi:hypothetical protein